ncbi:MAG: PAS domain-containing protein [Sideroxyarcus sp.]
MNLQIENRASREVDVFAKTTGPEWFGQLLSERQDPPALSLDERGMILDCSKSFRTLFGFQRSDLVWQHVSTLFPQLAEIELVQAGQVNSLLSYLCRCGKLYQAINRQGDSFSISLSFVRIEYKGRGTVRLIVHPFIDAECEGIA